MDADWKTPRRRGLERFAGQNYHPTGDDVSITMPSSCLQLISEVVSAASKQYDLKFKSLENIINSIDSINYKDRTASEQLMTAYNFMLIKRTDLEYCAIALEDRAFDLLSQPNDMPSGSVKPD